MNKDYYQVLGVAKNATDAQIKSAYRRLAKKYHPDMNPGNENAKQKFEEVGEAYRILGDKDNRRIYDKCGSAAFENGMDPKKYEQAYDEAQKGGFGGFGGNAGGFNGFGGFGGNGNSGTYTNGNTTYHWSTDGSGFGGDDMFGSMFEDLFRQAGHGSSNYGSYRNNYRSNGFNDSGFGGASQGFGSSAYSGFGGAGQNSTASYDLKSSVTIGFDEAIKGCQKQIRLQDPATGQTSNLLVSIPAGIADGKSIRLHGKGRSDGQGHTGDLLIEIHVAPKEGCRREGQDLYVTENIPFTTAVLGGQAMLHTINGNFLVKIKPGTQSGSKIRLRGKGVQKVGHPDVRGDLYAVVQIEVPTDLTMSERRKLKEFAKLYESHRDASQAAS